VDKRTVDFFSSWRVFVAESNIMKVADGRCVAMARWRSSEMNGKPQPSSRLNDRSEVREGWWTRASTPRACEY
jgi:hypothetical protein